MITQEDIDDAEFCVGEVLEVCVPTASTEVVLECTYMGAANGKLDICVARTANLGSNIGFDELGRKVQTSSPTEIRQYNQQSRSYSEIKWISHSHAFKSIKGDFLGLSVVVETRDSELLLGKIVSITGPVSRGVKINSLSDMKGAIQLFSGITNTSTVHIMGRPGILLAPLFSVEEEYEGEILPEEKEQTILEKNGDFFAKLAEDVKQKSGQYLHPVVEDEFVAFDQLVDIRLLAVSIS